MGLVTYHDRYHIHKLLGLLCLVSFMARFYQGFDTDMGFSTITDIEHNQTTTTTTRRHTYTYTIGTIVIHWLLSFSSLLFPLPLKRMVGAWRIWPEYRLHSIIFASRNLCIMTTLLLVFGDHYYCVDQQSHCYYYVFLLSINIVLCTCYVADVASKSVPKETRSNTIRGLHAPFWAKYIFSILQFYATTACLVPTTCPYSKQYIMLFVVQINAFFMTLMRKNLISHLTVVALYGIVIIGGATIGLSILYNDGTFFYFVSISNFAAILRLGPINLNKYVLWICVSFVIYLTTNWNVIAIPRTGTMTGTALASTNDASATLKLNDDDKTLTAVATSTSLIIATNDDTIWIPVSILSIAMLVALGSISFRRTTGVFISRQERIRNETFDNKQ